MSKLQNALKTALLATLLASPMAAPLAGGGGAYQACEDLFPGGVIPTGPTENTLQLCKTAEDANNAPIFASLHNTQTKVPVWTAHRLTPEQLNTIQTTPAYDTRTDFFHEDPDVALDEQAQLKNYKNSGFDRGHMVRALDLNWSIDAYQTSYVMTNMAPQSGHLNSGVWLGLEKQFQKWVGEKNVSLWAFAGSWGQQTDPAYLQGIVGNTIVPACFYKVIVAKSENGAYKTLTAVFPNTLPNQKQKIWVNFVSTLDIVEQRSGLDFLKGLDLESGHDADFWGVDIPAQPADCT